MSDTGMDQEKWKMATEEMIESFPELIEHHTINIIFGAFGTILNIPLLIVFLTCASFREKYKMLIVLAIADTVNTLGIMCMGINRVQLYSYSSISLTVPVKSSWECSLEPWIWLRVIGDLWSPIIQVLMGIERILAVFYPMFYRRTLQGSNEKSIIMIGISALFVIISLIIGFIISWTIKDNGEASYFCGRKASFSTYYGSFIYLTNCIGYIIGTILNICAYQKAKRMKMAMSNENSSQMERLRYYLFISIISTLLVSIPNGISLFTVVIKKVADAISKPSVWATCINSSINIFVYFVLNQEFRRRVLYLLKFQCMFSSSHHPNLPPLSKLSHSRRRQDNESKMGPVIS